MPQIRFRDAANTLRTAARIRVRDATNTLRTIQRVRVRDAGNVLRTIWQYLSVSLDSTSAYGFDTGPTYSGTVTTSSVTATVAGGTAPFTYSWNFVSGNLGISPDTPNAATTTFTATVGDGVYKTAYFTCLITDANGALLMTDNVLVELNWAYEP